MLALDGWTGDLTTLTLWIRDVMSRPVSSGLRMQASLGADLDMFADPEPDAADDGEGEVDDDENEEEGEEEGEQEEVDDEGDDGSPSDLPALDEDDAGSRGADYFRILTGRGRHRTERRVVAVGGLEGFDPERVVNEALQEVLKPLEDVGTLTLAIVPLLDPLVEGHPLIVWSEVEAFETTLTRTTRIVGTAPKYVAPTTAATPSAPVAAVALAASVPRNAPSVASMSPADIPTARGSYVDAVERSRRAIPDLDTQDSIIMGLISRVMDLSGESSVVLQSFLSTEQYRVGALTKALDETGRSRTKLESELARALAERTNIEVGHQQELGRLRAEHSAELIRLRAEHAAELSRVRAEYDKANFERERRQEIDDLQARLARATEDAKRSKRRPTVKDAEGEDDLMGTILEGMLDKFSGGDSEGGTLDIQALRQADPSKLATGIKLLRPGKRKAALREIAKRDRGLAKQMIDDLTGLLDEFGDPDTNDGESE